MVKRLSQINKTAVFAWSPGQQAPPFIATGTAAGALDDSFSNASELELYKLDFSSSGVTSTGKIATTSRFNKLVWGNASSSNPYGVIAGGMENGELTLYDPSKILDGKSEEEAKIMANATHTGQIRGLDFNKFQHNLLASAGSNNEVYIWDLTNPNTPYMPGPKSQKADDITTVGWNGQVQHILATSSSTGQTVVWDLRNRKEVMTLAAPSMTAGRRSISSVVWHPDVATQLVTASEDDANPVVTLWDLRHAHSPEKVLAGHTKGVLSLSWCRQDSDLLMSCGKDCKTFIWNPNSGECLGELASDTNWTFQTEWCPRNPDLLASASFDGKISVYSLQNSGSDAEDHSSSAAVLDTAQDDPFSAAMNASAAAASAANAFSLRHPPKWLRCPVGASFSFGGKLVTFNNKSGQAAKQAAATLPPGQAPAPQTITRTAQIHAIVTDKEAVQRADELETALEQQSVEQLVQERVQQAKEKDDKESWEVIKTLLAEDAREQLMNYLGFKKSEVMAAVAKATADQKKEPVKEEEEEKEEEKKETETKPSEEQEEQSSEAESKPDDATATDNSASGLFGEDAGDDFFIQTTDPITTTVAQLEEEQADDGGISAAAAAAVTSAIKYEPLQLYAEGSSDTDRLITCAVILGDFESAVQLCLSTDRLSDALLFAICGGGDLLARTQQEYFKRQSKSTSYLKLLEYIIQEDLNAIVGSVSLEEWTSAIVVLCTFAKSEDFRPLCETLGARLEEGWSNSDSEASKEFRRHATLCYLAAGNLEKVSRIWIAEQEEEVEQHGEEVKAATLQALIEKVTIFRKVISFEDADLFETSEHKMSYEYPLSPLYDKYCEYAELLADQGKLTTALTYLSLTPLVYRKATFDKLSIVRDRVYQACPVAVASQFSQPNVPFESKVIGSAGYEAHQQPQSTTTTTAAAAAAAAAAPPVATHAYGQPAQSYGYQPYQPVAQQQPQQQAYAPVRSPVVSNSYAPLTNTYAPAATNAYTPASASSPYTPAAPPSVASTTTTSYAPPTATGPQTTAYQPATAQAAASAPNYGYNQPTINYNQPAYASPNNYNDQYGTTGYNVARPSIPAPPPVSGVAPLARSQQEPSAPPKKAEGAWNDPPMSIAKKVKSPKTTSAPAKRVMSPFPNQPAAASFVNAPPQQQQQQVPPPPPQGGSFPPPPMNRGPPQGPPMAGPPPRSGVPPQRLVGQTPPPQQQGMAHPPPPMMNQQHVAPPPQRNPLPPPPMNAAAPVPLAKRAPGPPPPQGGYYQPQRMN